MDKDSAAQPLPPTPISPSDTPDSPELTPAAPTPPAANLTPPSVDSSENEIDPAAQSEINQSLQGLGSQPPLETSEKNETDTPPPLEKSPELNDKPPIGLVPPADISTMPNVSTDTPVIKADQTLENIQPQPLPEPVTVQPNANGPTPNLGSLTNPAPPVADPPPLGGSAPPPLTSKPKASRLGRFNPKMIAGGLVVLLLVVGLGSSVLLSQLNQDTRRDAWETLQNAKAVCADGKVNISVSFTNTEPDQDKFCMNVVATDTQTGKSVDMGQVNPGETKTSVIETDSDSVSDGTVEFYLTWCNGGSEDDTFTADYSATTCQEVVAQCPLNPAEGDYLLNFSERIRANQGESGAQTMTDFNLPAGTYNVTLASFDDHSLKPDQSQTQETYYVILKDAGDGTVATTGTIGDLPDDQDYKSELVSTGLSVGSDVTKAIAYHGAYPNDNVNSIQPICALFSPQVEVSYSCNSDCETDSQCQSANSNYVCSSGKCRLGSNTGSETCSPPEVKLSCNSECTTEQQCRDVDSAFTCHQGRCRRDSNLESASCDNPTNYCNSDCDNDQQCRDRDANYICHNGNCRREDNRDNQWCEVPPLSCNDACVNDQQCEAIGSGYGCVNNQCRLEAYPDQADCRPPTGGPSPTPNPTSTPTATVPPEKQVDLPEAGSTGPTIMAAGAGAILLILGLGAMLVL